MSDFIAALWDYTEDEIIMELNRMQWHYGIFTPGEVPGEGLYKPYPGADPAARERALLAGAIERIINNQRQIMKKLDDLLKKAVKNEDIGTD